MSRFIRFSRKMWRLKCLPCAIIKVQVCTTSLIRDRSFSHDSQQLYSLLPEQLIVSYFSLVQWNRACELVQDIICAGRHTHQFIQRLEINNGPVRKRWQLSRLSLTHKTTKAYILTQDPKSKMHIYFICLHIYSKQKLEGSRDQNNVNTTIWSKMSPSSRLLWVLVATDETAQATDSTITWKYELYSEQIYRKQSRCTCN